MVRILQDWAEAVASGICTSCGLVLTGYSSGTGQVHNVCIYTYAYTNTIFIHKAESPMRTRL